jgi:hypothetical protein
MKSRPFALVSVLLGFGLALSLPLLHAADGPGSGAAAGKPKKETMRAAITKIEATSITVGSRTFKLADKVLVRIHNEVKGLADLKVGDVVKVKGVQEADGTYTANAILLDTDPKADKPAAEKK